MRKIAAVILLATLAAPIWALTPAQAVAAAEADVRLAPPHLRQYLRYLDLGEIPAKDRTTAYRVLCGHVQHLSRASDITRPVALAGGALLRLNIEDYGWSVALWESLADADPYYHTRLVQETVELWPGGRYDGVHYMPGAFRYRARKTVRALAPWLGNPLVVKSLVDMTQSSVPIVRGAWFFNQTAAQADRKPGYYDFLGVKDKKTFEALGGFDRKAFEKFRTELRASVADSGVTLQPRAIARFGVADGAYWFSLDFKAAVAGKNPLRVLGRDIEKEVDAIEAYITLPNGMWATGLFNGKGVRQDTAPDFIASDGVSRSTDKRVHVNVSCLRCHTNGGLKDIDDWTRNLIQPPLTLQSVDYKELRRLRQQYAKHLEPFLDRDRLGFEASVKEATGWTSKEYAKAYADFWSAFEDAKVDLAWAARDLGVSEKEFRAALDAQAKAGIADPVLSVFLLAGPRRRTIGIRTWLEVYATAATIVYGPKGAK